MQAASEEVVGGLDENEFLRIGSGGDQGIELLARAEGVARSADEQFRLRTRVQEVEAVGAWEFVIAACRSYGRSKANHKLHAWVGAGGAKADGGAERESGEDEREMKFGIEPIERDANVIDFAAAMVMLALAESGAAEIKAQNGKSEMIERFHRMKDDFVVERPSEEGMGMADGGGVSCVGRTGVEQGFEASGGAVEK